VKTETVLNLSHVDTKEHFVARDWSMLSKSSLQCKYKPTWQTLLILQVTGVHFTCHNRRYSGIKCSVWRQWQCFSRNYDVNGDQA